MKKEGRKRFPHGAGVPTRRTGLVMAVAASIALFSVVPGAEGAPDATVNALRVCVQKHGSKDSVGDLNVRVAACKAGEARYWLAYGNTRNWIDSLTGTPGPAGEAGPQGPAGPQ